MPGVLFVAITIAITHFCMWLLPVFDTEALTVSANNIHVHTESGMCFLPLSSVLVIASCRYWSFLYILFLFYHFLSEIWISLTLLVLTSSFNFALLLSSITVEIYSVPCFTHEEAKTSLWKQQGFPLWQLNLAIPPAPHSYPFYS